MAVTTTQFTTNSYKVTVANELSGSNNIIAGVNTAITTLGWTLYDSVDQTQYSPVVTNVYQAINADGVSYKYAIVRFDTLKLRINLSACEAWNVTTHVATNETWHSDGCFYHGYDVRDSFIFVSATARHLLIQTWILNEPGHWSGIFEAERVAEEDISSNSAPCFFYTNSVILGSPWGIDGDRLSNTSFVMMSFPRTPDGYTGDLAGGIYAPTTSRGMWPPYIPSGNVSNVGANTVYSTSTMDLNLLHLGSWHYNIGGGMSGNNIWVGGVGYGQTSSGSVWGWDSASIPISPVSVDAMRKHMPFGRIYDMAITKPIGNQLDLVTFSANANGGWPQSIQTGGANTQYLILPLNGGPERFYSNNYNSITGNPQPTVNGGINIVYSNNHSVVYGTLSMVGNNVWAAANNGIWTWNMGNGMNTAANLVYLNTNGVFDIMFDGKRSIYGTTNTGLIQIDTETFATNAISSTEMLQQGGCAYLNMDNKFIYATNRTSNTRPFCYTVYRSNNTVNATIQMAASIALNVASGWATPTPDYKGFVYLVNTPGTTGSQQLRLLVANSELGGVGVANSIVPWLTPTASDKQTNPCNFFYEPNTDRLYLFIANFESSAVIEYDQNRTFNIIANTAALGINSFYVNRNGRSQLAYQVGSQGIDYRGDLNIIQHRGYFHLQSRQPGINMTTANASYWNAKVVLHHPNPHWSWQNRVAGQLSRVWETGNTQSSAVGFGSTELRFPSNFTYTNGIRIANQYYMSNTESRIQTSNNHFGLTPFGGYPTSRILIKA
jgi:hypothetical protein